MEMLERVARVVSPGIWRLYGLRASEYARWGRVEEGQRLDSLDVATAVLNAMLEPTEEMLATAVTMTDVTDAHMDKAAAVLEGMPPLSPAASIVKTRP